MNVDTLLPLMLKLSAVAQIAVAVLNLFLVRLLHWRPHIEQLPLLPRQVFMVHLWFISLTLLIFGGVTWQYADDMARGGNPLAAWLCGGIALFWGIRTLLQIMYYSSSHWRGKRAQTVAHVVLLGVYVSMTVAYAAAAARGGLT